MFSEPFMVPVLFLNTGQLFADINSDLIHLLYCKSNILKIYEGCPLVLPSNEYREEFYRFDEFNLQRTISVLFLLTVIYTMGCLVIIQRQQRHGRYKKPYFPEAD